MTDVFNEYREKGRRAEELRQEAVAFFGENRTTRGPKIKATVARPVCAYCGKTYGERAVRYETLRFAIGEPITPYQGNARLICEQIVVGDHMGPDNSPGVTVRRDTWDGESYRSQTGKTDPFCTATCAVAFAKAAYRAGYRMKE